MSTSSCNLLNLLRLLADDLPTDVAIRLREQLVDDARFAEQYRRLNRLVGKQRDAEELLTHVDDVDVLDVAAFIDGTMSDESCSHFEQRCWQSEALLCEVVSVWQATCESHVQPESRPKESEVRSLVADLLGSSAGEPVEAARNGSVRPPVPEFDLGMDSQPILKSRRPPQTGARSRRQKILAIAVAGVMLVVLSLLLSSWKTGSDQIAKPDPTPKSRDQGPQIVDTPPDSGPSPEEIPEPIPQKPDSKPPRFVQEDTPRKIPDPEETPRPNPPKKPQQNRTLVRWEQLAGVAAARSIDSDVWSGWLNEATDEVWRIDQPAQLLTLANSRVSGRLAGGENLVADAESMIEIASVSGSTLESPENAQPPLLQFTVQRGRLAIEGLKLRQKVRVRVGKQTFEVEATQGGSVFAVERQAGNTVLAAYRGELRMAQRRFSRRTWLNVDRTGDSTPFRPQRPQDWYRSPRDDVQIPANVRDAFNRADDLATVATRLVSSRQSGTALVAAQAALYCAPASGQGVSVNLVRQLTRSRVEVQRVALIRWLLMHFRQDPLVGESRLFMVCRQQQIDPQSQRKMQVWFQSAARGRKPSIAQLTDLMVALRDPSSLFLRQCAKFFLQQILKDPLNEYDPMSPGNRRAITSVASKLRAWQKANP